MKCMTEENGEKFTAEMSRLNTNLEVFNQKFEDALVLVDKNMELRLLKHERDCPARKTLKGAGVDAETKRAMRFWSSMVPVLLRIVLPLLGVGGVTYTAINSASQQPAAQTAPAETGE